MTSRAGQVSFRRRGGRLGWLLWTLTVALLAAAVWAGSGPLGRELGWQVDGGAPGVDAALIEALHPQPERLGAGVIDQARQPKLLPADPAQVGQAMAATAPELPGTYGGAVANLSGGGLDYDLAANTALIPASTMKVMTSIAVLDALGGQHRFTTSVLALSPTTIVLVGGGDPLLSSTPTSYPYAGDVTLPTTAELAAATAAALSAHGIGQVSLSFDDTLFSGPVWHPDWATADRTYQAPISALTVDEAAGMPGVDSPSPAAARTFADQLRAAGIDVVGEPTPAAAAGGTLLAKVESAPVAQLVQELLVHSDNFIAEVMLRQLAIAKGLPGSFDGGQAAMTAALGELGLWREGQAIADGSGLSMHNRLTPAALVAALQLAANRDDLADLLAGLPVGCATGTLTERFTDARSVPARGQVRAKTGTLDQVSALAGYTPTRDGGLVAFAFIGNDLPRDTYVRGWFDHVGAALAGCDCVA